MKKLPVGIQTFSKIIEGNKVYVDKTRFAYQLIQNGEYYFLSRPRRFGKSLFLDTLKEIFQGNKDLFKDLYIYDKWNWDITYPVIKISMGSGVIRDKERLFLKLSEMLKDNQRQLDIQCDSSIPEICFKELIIKAFEKYGQKVVILIDEYDKAILDNITDSDTAREMRNIMKDFYGVIKDNDTYIRFVFITGVSRFSKMNLFSGLNNLEDITIDPAYASICGYTHDDLLTVFKEHLQGADMEKVKEWYNGYNYLGEKVYNPFDILLFIKKHFEFLNYWWQTGNPSFLIDMLKTGKYFIPEIEDYTASEELLNTFDVDNIDLIALLWQTGYLTIDKKIFTDFGISYRLKTPNKEIQTSLNSLFITYLTTQTGEKFRHQQSIFNALKQGDIEAFKNALMRLFSAIPYNHFTNNKLLEYEGYYASVVYAYLASFGFEIVNEDVTNLGRIDLTLKIYDKIYILEFKLSDKATGEALKQIKDRRYYEKYLNENKEIYLIGIEFSREKRNIIGFDWEKISLD